MDVNEENLKVIPEVPKEYRDRLMQEQELDNMMMAAGLDPSKRYKKASKDKDIHSTKYCPNKTIEAI